MTNEQPQVQRRLRRRTDDRVIAGVASGLGEYFNVDPLLFRIGFVASLVFGGLGIFLYAAAWLLVPTEAGEPPAAQRFMGRAGLLGGLLGALLILAGAATFLGVVTDVSVRSGGVAALGFAVIAIAIGAYLLRRGGPDDPSTPSTPSGPGGGPAPSSEAVAGAPSEAAPVEPVRSAVRRAPRPPSPLAWYVIGAAFVGVGLVAFLGTASVVDVGLGQFFGLALAAIGVGLLVGTWWGHARMLIVVGLLLLPFAWAASLIDVPLEGDWGAHRYSPASADEVRDEYRLVGGDLVLDLTGIDTGGEPVTVSASVAMGELLVLLPDDAGVDLDAAVGGGRLWVLGAAQNGTRLHDATSIAGDGAHFTLDLEAGLGYVRVERR